MRKKDLQTLLSLLFAVAMCVNMAQPVSAIVMPQEAPVQSLKPVISYDVRHDVSAPLSSLVGTSAAPLDSFEQPKFELPKALNAAVQAFSPDPVLQNAPVLGSMPGLIAHFEGVNNVASVAPPDTEGDIGYDPATGKKYYMQWVNLHIQAWDVTDPSNPVAMFASPIPGNAIWTGFGGRCESDNSGDPIVLYDEIANRWMISQFAVSGMPFYNCMAISTTSDPSGSYYRYAFLYSANKMNDYPKFGVWNDGYYMTVNQFLNASSWAGAGAAVYERDQMLIGGAARQVVFDLEAVNNNFGGMLPADFEGTPPPAGSPAYFAEVDDSSYGLGPVDEMRIWEFHTDWATNTYSFGLAGLPNQVIPVEDYNLICPTTRNCVPQPNTQRLDAIGDRLMFRLAYRHFDDGTQRMVVNHSVNVGTPGNDRAGVRWYELTKTGSDWTITQQGTYGGDNPATDTTHRWMGSVAMDRMGNIALGYSMSSGTLFPSIGLVGRLVTDPPNTLPQGELIAFPGPAAQNGVNRWGDYSSMSLDPEDGCTFWYTTEYSNGSWNWATRIMSFKFPNCTALPTGTLTGTVTDAVTGNPIEGAHVSSGVFGGFTNADGVYTIFLPENTYDLTATAFGYLPGTANGVEVIVDTITTQNFALDLAPSRQVSGVVSDGTVGGHAWPLYAAITILGYPGGTIYTNPLDGSYSVMLPEGIDYPFNVEAMVPGYQPASALVSVVGADVVQDFGLLSDPLSCAAPGYTLAGGFLENFDSVSAGSLPANWQSVSLGGPAWSTNAGTSHPGGYPAVSAPNVAFFNSYTVSSGSALLYYDQPFDMTNITDDQVTFYMFHDPGWPDSHDSLQVNVSTDGGANWTPVGSVFDRVGDTPQWEMHSVDLSAYSAETSVWVGFMATSEYGNDIHIDNVVIGDAPVCTKIPGGLLMGYGTDNNTNLPLNDASVEIPGAPTLFTAPTPADDNLDDGFYYGFAPEDLSMVTYSKPLYTPVTDPINMADDGTLWWDFALDAGLLAVDPTEFSVSVPMNASGDATLSLSNDGGVTAEVNVQELNLPAYPAPVNPEKDPNVRHLGPKNFNLTSLKGIPYYLFPPRSAPSFNVYGAGDLVSSFPSGLAGAWGTGVDQTTGNVWVSNLSAIGGDDLDYEFLPDGTPTGNTIDTAPWLGVFAADMAYDPINGTLWQVNVGGDNCIYELNPYSLTSTGNKICPAFGTSERGLAYDPSSDTFFAGSWNDALIKRFNRAGDILEQVDVGLPIAGLAYNSSTGHLFVTNSADSSLYDISVLDVNNNYAELGGFNVAALGDYEQAGLEFACSGHLWATNQGTKEILEIDSGETGVCDYADIPWLSLSPDFATIDPATTTDVTLTFDATGLQPGVYEAQLSLKHNTPYRIDNIPVSMTVTLPAGYGTVKGAIFGLGLCDTTPTVPINGATVEIRDNADTLVATLTTGPDGKYTWSDVVANNDYTLTVTAAGYVGTSVPVTLIDSEEVTQDFDLRLNQPCISADPTNIDAYVLVGGTDNKTVTLSNTGAASTDFTFVYPNLTLVNEGFEGAGFPPLGWTQEITNPDYTWMQSQDYVHSGSFGARVPWDYSQDEWLVSQELSLTRATLSMWSMGSIYWCRDTFDGCDLNVWIVVGDPGGADDIFVGTLDNDWTASWTWSPSTFVLDSLLPAGPFKIGFQYLGDDGADVGLDDIMLTSLATDEPWLTESPTTGNLPADTGTADIDLAFDATGMALGDYHTNLYVEDDAARLIWMHVAMHVVASLPPTAIDDAYSVDEDTVLNVDAAAGVLVNDTDPESDPLTAALISDPKHGTVTFNANGSFTYTPEADFNGEDSFTYKANDGTLDSNEATVTITVNAVNDAPVAVDDAYNVNEDAVLEITALAGVLSNDTDIEGDALTAALVADPAHGTVTLNPDGSFTYTPEADFNGVDTFTYKANDGDLDSNVATVTITVNPINDAPVAVDDEFSMDQDTVLTATAAQGLLVNDTDVDGDPLTVVGVSDVTHGTLVLNADGSFTYTPAAGFVGTDSFTYKANDGTLDSNVATVTITVNSTNDAPVAVDDAYTMNEDTVLTIAAGAGVLANDTDADGDPLTAILVLGPLHGTLTLNADGSFTYTPNGNFFGTDTFTYKANDGLVDSNVATVTITVTDVPEIIYLPFISQNR